MKTTKLLPYCNTSISYGDHGHGPAVVLLHGFTESQAIWNDFTPALAKKFRVITIDLPGHGSSGMLGDVHTMKDMAAAVKAVLDHLAVSRCTLVGHSLGGYVSLEFARMFPDMVAGLGLFHSMAAADSEEARQGRDKAIAIIRESRKDFLMGFIPSLFAPASREALSTQIDTLIATAQGMSDKAIIAAMEGMKMRSDSREILENATYPVLFIAGQQDSRIPSDLVLEQAKLPVKSYVLLLKNVGHMGWAEAPNETRKCIEHFAELCRENS